MSVYDKHAVLIHERTDASQVHQVYPGVHGGTT